MDRGEYYENADPDRDPTMLEATAELNELPDRKSETYDDAAAWAVFDKMFGGHDFREENDYHSTPAHDGPQWKLQDDWSDFKGDPAAEEQYEIYDRENQYGEELPIGLLSMSSREDIINLHSEDPVIYSYYNLAVKYSISVARVKGIIFMASWPTEWASEPNSKEVDASRCEAMHRLFGEYDFGDEEPYDKDAFYQEYGRSLIGRRDLEDDQGHGLTLASRFQKKISPEKLSRFEHGVARMQKEYPKLPSRGESEDYRWSFVFYEKGKNIAEKDRPIRIRTRTGEMRDATPEERLQFFRANVSRRKHRAKKLFI